MQTENTTDIREEYKICNESFDIKDASSTKLTIYTIATHSGSVNDNNRYFDRSELKKAVKSFMQPFPKPVLTHHASSTSDPIGRIVAATYIPAEKWETTKIKYDLDNDIVLNEQADGAILLKIDIFDEDAITKIKDHRYLTVSIGGSATTAVCSICGKSKYLYRKDGDDEACIHTPGHTYDGEKAYTIYSGVTFNEISFVNIPADKYAKVAGFDESEKLKDKEGTKEDAMSEKTDNAKSNETVATADKQEQKYVLVDEYKKLEESNKELTSFVKSMMNESILNYRTEIGIDENKDYTKHDIAILRILLDEYNEIKTGIKLKKLEELASKQVEEQAKAKEAKESVTEEVVTEEAATEEAKPKEILEEAALPKEEKVTEAVAIIEDTNTTEDIAGTEDKGDEDTQEIVEDHKLTKEAPPVISDNSKQKRKPSKISMRDLLKIKA